MSETSTRQRLLDAALNLIWRSSYGSVGVDEICQLADVKKGSFYHAFKSKSDLAAAAFEYYWEHTCSRFDQLFSPELPPLDRLTGYCKLIITNQKKQYKIGGKVLGCPFSSVGCELSTRDETVRQKAHELSIRIVKYLESAVHDLMQEGLIETADAAEVAKEIYAYSTGVVTQAKIDNDIKSVERITPGIFRLLGIKNLVRK
ncbi:MAG TPA: TetR/AcrR family transcriptional regulator [Tepidisphaeraceae bacterium]|jgi:TetR/AcrR family transcriptional repressor of nem operon|nr:TetR/AcrR family transcriptional regulator [Tepidisphaeraceae bacterium]